MDNSKYFNKRHKKIILHRMEDEKRTCIKKGTNNLCQTNTIHHKAISPVTNVFY